MTTKKLWVLKRVILMSNDSIGDTEKRLVCPNGRMVKLKLPYEEGDPCPCTVCEGMNVFQIKEIPEENLEKRKKLFQLGTISPKVFGLDYSLQHQAKKAREFLENQSIIDHMIEPERIPISEGLQILRDVGWKVDEEPLKSLMEDPYSVCTECGKVCKDNKGRKIHKKKTHGHGDTLQEAFREMDK